MKKYLLLTAILLTGCLNTTMDPYDDTEDIEFLEEYAQREGVMTTESGLMYRVLEESEESSETPNDDQFVFISYEGNSVDEAFNYGTGNDLQIMLPAEWDNFAGLAEGVQLMSPGSTYEMVFPSELAQRDGRAFIFEVEMDSFLEYPDEYLSNNAQEEDINMTDSGLQYRVIEEGDGESPSEESTVTVNYKGTYTNGYVFDENDDSVFNLASVVPGFSEGIQLMQEGARYELFLPSDIGYGDNPPGGIVPGAVLVFEVELLEIND